MDPQISTKVAKDPRDWFGYDDIQQNQQAHNNNAQILNSIFTTPSFKSRTHHLQANFIYKMFLFEYIL